MDEDRPPFEREVAAMVLGVRDLAAPQRRAAEAAAAVAHDALRTATAALGDRVSPLTALGDELALSPLARDLLVLIAAPGLWGELARLYGILANDEHRAVCDEQLLVELCRGRVDRHAIGRELDRDQPLVRHGVVHVAADRARPFAALAVDPLVLKLLRADPLDADLDAGTRLIPVTRTLDQLRVPRAALARVVAALAADDALARLVIRGRAARGGGRTVAATLAARAGRTLGAVDAARLLREQRLDLLGLHLRRCALRGWLPLIEGLETIASDDAVVRERVRDVVRDHPGPLVLRLPRDATPPVDPGFVALDLPATSVAERADHWQAVLGRRGLAVRDVDELAARFAIGPGLIERVAAQVDAARGDAADAGALVDVELDDGVRQHLASQLGQVATRVGRLANWSQVILPPDILDSVLELISRIRHRRVVYDTWGFDRVMSTSRGVTALFQGGPGTGKTMVASAIANDLGLDLYRVDLSRVMSKWIGETEQNLARVFDAAEDGQAILLFDEADSLFAKRTKVQSSVDRYANLEVNYLLQRFDSFEGIAILTTNFGTAIDPAFKRRLSFRLTFPFPDDETRELLWKAHLPEDLPRQGPLDLADLARRYRMSGGYIRNAALRAAFLAAEEHATLSQDHLERAIRAEFREIGKLADTGVLE
ncbi:MAG: ATP-binding protein [Kofleriaceae bacterium]|nr:ATP-binding protein [Kofleriaceae bacterium]